METKEMTPAYLYRLADEAGREAVEALQVRPMVVTQRENPLDDTSAIKKAWYVEDGVCGFAELNIRPATCKFAKWMVSNGHARKDSYKGGICYWISQYGQSMQKKEAYAQAFSEVLKKHGITVYVYSRMD